MYNLDDYNLDRLSREAAELYETPGKPSWEQLQQQLDRELPVKKDRRRRGFFFFLIIAALLAGGGVWRYLYLRQQQETGTASIYETSKTVSPAGGDAATVSGEIKELHEKPGKQHSPAAMVNPRSHETTSQKEIHAAPEPPSPQTHIPHQPTRPAEDAKQIVKNKRDIARLGHQGITVSPRRINNRTVKHKSDIAGNPGQYSPTGGNDTGTGDLAPDSVEPLITKGAPVNDTGAAVTAPPTEQKNPEAGKNASDSSGKATAKKQSRVTGRGFSAALTGGADFSTVKFTYGDKTGYTAGITGAWHFNSRWSVHTGALYTQKNYKLRGSDYNPPVHYWTQYVDLQSVEGYCRMWEVPVLARYSFSSGGLGKFFLSAGLSSYFMRKESYNYYYKLNNSTYERPWTNKTHLNHWFSILDLSAGVERKLNNRFSLEAEPYARVPLGGVGFGNIRLSSLGLNLSLRYRQPAKR